MWIPLYHPARAEARLFCGKANLHRLRSRRPHRRLVLPRQLTARGGDFPAPTLADVGVHPSRTKHVLKGEHRLPGRTFEGEIRHFGVVDQVDVGAKAFGDGGELAGMFGEGVQAAGEHVEHDVFQRQFAAGLLEIILARFDDLLDRDLLCPRDDLPAEFIVGGVERDGKGDGQFEIGEALHLRREADGADGDLSAADVKRPVSHKDSNGGDGDIEIGKGLAHAHEDDVRKASFDWQIVCQTQGLFDDLPDREIIFESFEPAGAKGAFHRAADLRGEAGGAAVGDDGLAVVIAGIIIGGDHDAFGQSSDLGSFEGGPLEQHFFRAVGTGEVTNDGAGEDVKAFRQLSAVAEGEIGHLVEGGGSFLKNPFVNLLRTEARHAQVSKLLSEFFGGQCEDVDACHNPPL